MFKTFAMRIFTFNIFVYILFIGTVLVASSRSAKTFVSLSSDETFKEDTAETPTFRVFCYEGVNKSIFHIWRSVHLQVLEKPKSYVLFHGVNHTDVYTNYESRLLWRPSFLFGSSDSIIEFPAFSQYCIGIETKGTYSIQLQTRTLNYWKALQTLLGVCLFVSAPALSRHPFFHYAIGIMLGVLASVMILLYIASRLIPRRSISYLVLGFGSSFFLYMIQMLWHNFYETVTSYSDFIVGYCVISAFFSFMVCYRLGPVKNSRTHNLIQWLMQAISFLLIFFSSEYRELSTAIILVLITANVIPPQWIRWIMSQWHRRFPPKIKLLTEIEYIEQGERETKKALENLRQYCSSPDCDTWKIVKKLKDPARFATFIETGSQYTDQELLEYNYEDLSYEFCGSEVEPNNIGD